MMSGKAARWWCQVWVTASGMVAGDPLRHAVHVHPHRQGGHGGARIGSRPRMVAIRIGEVARWWCQGWVTALGMVAMLIGKAVDGLQRSL